jgi:hypothetical protein
MTHGDLTAAVYEVCVHCAHGWGLDEGRMACGLTPPVPCAIITAERDAKEAVRTGRGEEDAGVGWAWLWEHERGVDAGDRIGGATEVKRPVGRRRR